jgi:hypothetical protein
MGSLVHYRTARIEKFIWRFACSYEGRGRSSSVGDYQRSMGNSSGVYFPDYGRGRSLLAFYCGLVDRHIKIPALIQ